MNNETLLKRLIELKNTLPEIERGIIDRCINTNFRYDNSEDTVALLTNLILDVKADMQMDYAKKNGTSEKLKSAKRLLKQSPDRVEALKYAYTEESGIQNICNSYALVRLTEPLTLPELPPKMEYVNVKRIIPKQANPITLELPTVSELKTYYKLKKAETKERKIAYYFGENLPKVDVEMLIDVMTLVPDAVATWEKFMIEFKNDKGDYGLLCIMREKSND